MRFLLATDGSTGAGVALDFLTALPLSSADHVTVLTVPTYSFVGTERLDPARDEGFLRHGDGAARRIAESARARITVRGVPVSVDLRTGPVAEAAEAAALEHACDVIVVGSRGLGALTGSLLGSLARQLARHAAIPVLVVRVRRTAPRRVLAAVDGSDDARAAVSLLSRMPLPIDTGVTLLHVLSDLRSLIPEIEERAGEVVIEQAAALLGPRILDHRVAERGHVAEQILARATLSNADLIVLGARGQTAGGPPHGSVADRVLSQAHCAVLVAKAPLGPRRVAERTVALSHAVLAL